MINEFSVSNTKTLCFSSVWYWTLGKISSPEEWSGAEQAAQVGSRVKVSGGGQETFICGTKGRGLVMKYWW